MEAEGRYPPFRRRPVAGSMAAAFAAILLWYAAEPWIVTFIDDGPFLSKPFDESADDLAVISAVSLTRFGAPVYTLETRLSSNRQETVFVLRDRKGGARWMRTVDAPSGSLGAIALADPSVTWNLGWRVRISPSRQESGELYLSPFGRFRFLHHSW